MKASHDAAIPRNGRAGAARQSEPRAVARESFRNSQSAFAIPQVIATLVRRMMTVILCGLLVCPLTLGADEPPKKDEPPLSAAVAEKKDDSKEKENKEKKKEPPKDRYFAITNATVHTITNGDLYAATILTKNGKIIEVGPRIAFPQETETLDASGFHVYPGLIAANGGSVLGSEPPDDTTDVFSLHMSIALAGGITTAVAGNSAANLTYGFVGEMIVKRDLFKSLRYTTDNPDGRRKIRADLEKVRQYLRDVQAYEEKKKTDPQAKEPDKEWIKGDFETYLKLLAHDAVAVVDANSAHELLDVCELAKRFDIRAVVRGATEGWTVAQEMARAGIPAIITPRRTTDRDERFNRPNGASIENAAILYRHGVPLAFVPSITTITLWGLAGRDLLHLNMEAAFAVRGGLPQDAAFRAITIDAARVLGIESRVGSIEVGKDANFAIFDGDPLHYMSLVRWTVVGGRVAYDKQKESLYSHIRPHGDRDAPPPDDYWPRRLGEGP